MNRETWYRSAHQLQQHICCAQCYRIKVLKLLEAYRGEDIWSNAHQFAWRYYEL